MKNAGHAILLTLGMFLYSGLAVGVFQNLHYIATLVWVPALIAFGVLLRRWLWPDASNALRVVGGAFLCFAGVMTVICGFNASGEGIANALWNSGQMILWFHTPWFWVPFATGVALGGLFRKQDSQQAATSDGEEP